MPTPKDYVAAMMTKDKYSQWLGLQIEEIKEGYCRLSYYVTNDMLNGFGIIHGGVLFAASDSAFAFACNTYGMLTVALDANISFTQAAKEGEVLTVEAKEIHKGRKTGVYEVRTTSADGVLLSFFKGTAYTTSQKIID